jgi:hypothetical protein
MVYADRQYIEYNLLDSYILLIGITINVPSSDPAFGRDCIEKQFGPYGPRYNSCCFVILTQEESYNEEQLMRFLLRRNDKREVFS